MNMENSFLKKYSLVIYFFLAYLIAWGGILIVVAKRGFNPQTIQLNDGVLMFFAMILGPSLSSITLTALLEGKAEVKNLFGRMTNWKVGLNRYAFLATVPIISIFILLILSALVSPVYKPNTNIIFGVIIGALAGLFEETGWTGFALPRLQSRYNVFISGLTLGLLWATWHIMADYWGNIAKFGGYWFLNFVVYWIFPLTAYRILMAWVYKNTNSLLFGQLMHMFYTGTLIAVSPTLSVTDGLLWEALFAAALWIVIAVLFIRDKGK